VHYGVQVKRRNRFIGYHHYLASTDIREKQFRLPQQASPDVNGVAAVAEVNSERYHGRYVLSEQ
jgi:hypothetical protein